MRVPPRAARSAHRGPRWHATRSEGVGGPAKSGLGRSTAIGGCPRSTISRRISRVAPSLTTTTTIPSPISAAAASSGSVNIAPPSPNQRDDIAIRDGRAWRRSPRGSHSPVERTRWDRGSGGAPCARSGGRRRSSRPWVESPARIVSSESPASSAVTTSARAPRSASASSRRVVAGRFVRRCAPVARSPSPKAVASASRGAGVTHDRHRCRRILVSLRGVDVDPDQAAIEDQWGPVPEVRLGELGAAATTASHSASRRCADGRRIDAPSDRGSCSETAPFPFAVVMTGAPAPRKPQRGRSRIGGAAPEDNRCSSRVAEEAGGLGDRLGSGLGGRRRLDGAGSWPR